MTESVEKNNNIPKDDKTNAKRRWKILANAILKTKNKDDELSVSVRRFNSFDLIQQDVLQSKTIKEEFIGSSDNWFTYKIKDFTINIHHMSNKIINPSNLIDNCDNTGNICIWPSEEILTYIVLKDLNQFKNSWTLELGGGMSCLAGLLIAKYGNPYLVKLTDGNNLSVENVQKSIRLNVFKSCYINCSILKWENVTKRIPSEKEKFNFILSADCLFFDNVRGYLIDTIWYYLAKSGIAYVVAPARGTTLDTFITNAVEKGFTCKIQRKYSNTIWQKHIEMMKCQLYDENLHYPILIKLTK